MKRDFRLQTLGFRLVAVVLYVCLTALVAGTAAANPYEAIVGRNVFGLKPPTLNAAPPPVPAAAATTFKLLGISTILDRRQVMLKVKTAARPPELAREQSYLLAEGQRDGDIEVLEIDAVAGTVKIKHNDTELPPLTMKDDAERPAVGAALPGPGAPNPQVPRLPGVPAPATTAVPPTDPGVVPTTGGSGRTIPTRSLRTSATDGAGVGAAAPQRSTEETAALYEINRAKNELLRQSGVALPTLPQHPMFKGAQ